jgi:tetratricopeptide (TPR) repeat protein
LAAKYTKHMSRYGVFRRPIGLASGDPELRKLIPFQSTPETERFGHLADAWKAAVGASPRALSREAEMQVPVSLTEQAVARLQEDGKQAFKDNDLPRAIEAWSEAIEQVRSLPCPAPKKLESTRAAQLLANRCQAYLKLGKEEEALDDAEAACNAAPGWPKAHYRLGTVLHGRGQLQRAHAVLSQGLQLDQSNDEMRRVLHKVKEDLLAARSTAVQAGAVPAEEGSAQFGPACKRSDASSPAEAALAAKRAEIARRVAEARAAQEATTTTKATTAEYGPPNNKSPRRATASSG